MGYLEILCKDCGVQLIVGENWYESYSKTRNRKCIKCSINYSSQLIAIKRKTNLYFNIRERTNQANISESNKKNKRKIVNIGNGSYKSLYDVISSRTSDSNFYRVHINGIQTSRKKDKVIKTPQTIATFISQNYTCPVTNLPLDIVYSDISLDHITPDEKGGFNVIENIIFVHRTINLGKNGDYYADALDVMLRIYFPDENQKEIRKARIDEIMEKMWSIRDIQPLVYEKIKDYTYKQLNDILDRRLTVNDILNTT